MFYSYIHILPLVFHYTQMMMINVPYSPENMNLIQKVCGIIGSLAVTAFDGTHYTALHCIALVYWLFLSVWPLMTSRLQTPSKRLAAILCLLAKGWGSSCGGLWYGLISPDINLECRTSWWIKVHLQTYWFFFDFTYQMAFFKCS